MWGNAGLSIAFAASRAFAPEFAASCNTQAVTLRRSTLLATIWQRRGIAVDKSCSLGSIYAFLCLYSKHHT